MRLTEEEKRLLREEMKEAARKMDELLDKIEAKANQRVMCKKSDSEK